MRMANLLDTSVSRCNDMWQVALFGRLATSASMCPPPVWRGEFPCAARRLTAQGHRSLASPSPCGALAILLDMHNRLPGAAHR
jgi:hypothetical protein